MPEQGVTWMSHGDYMAKVPAGVPASWPIRMPARRSASADEARGFYGVQFHPEVNHTEHGLDMLRNFLYEVCGASGWRLDYGRLHAQVH